MQIEQMRRGYFFRLGPPILLSPSIVVVVTAGRLVFGWVWVWGYGGDRPEEEEEEKEEEEARCDVCLSPPERAREEEEGDAIGDRVRGGNHEIRARRRRRR